MMENNTESMNNNNSNVDKNSLILDMAHHNPGELIFESQFTKPLLFKKFGYSGIGLCILLSLGFIVLTKTVTAMTPETVAELNASESAEYQQPIQLEKITERDFNSRSSAEKEKLAHLRNIHPCKNFSYVNHYILIISIVFVVAIYSVTEDLNAAFFSDITAACLLKPLGYSPEEDAGAVKMSHSNPARPDHLKLFGPNSNWQFRKRNKVDSIGFAANILMVIGIVAMLYIFVELGA